MNYGIQGVLHCFLLLTLISYEGVAQKGNQASTWKTILISVDEPGEFLTVSGAVFLADGVTPVAGVTVYVYQTDADGLYRKGERGDKNPRIRGTMVTNAEGMYEFKTIMPAPYPKGNTPAHIHYVISGEGIQKQYDELQFEGDPLVLESDLAGMKEERSFAKVQPVTHQKDGTMRCVRDIRLK